MLCIVMAVFLAFRSTLRTRGDLEREDLALRQQLVVAKGQTKRSSLKHVDRHFRAVLARYWDRWRYVINIVKPYDCSGVASS